MKLVMTGLVFVVLTISSISVAYASVGNGSQASPAVTTNKNSLWAGYGVVGPRDMVPVQSVWISFIQPRVTCDPSLTTAQDVLFLAGIDGLPAGVSDFAFAGTEAFCAVGSFIPVYNMVLSGAAISVPVKPGDRIFGELNVSLSFFLEDVVDATTGMGGGAKIPTNGAKLIAGECIVSSGTDPASGLPLPLGNFAKAKFGQDYTGGVPLPWPSCNVAVGTNAGFGHPIGAVGAPFALVKYKMFNSALSTVRAKPSALTADLSSFKVTWKSYGP